jgi:SAM-dependent methyltransferase
LEPTKNLAQPERNIEWDDQKISRLWDYYSRTPPYSDIYFSKLFGHHIIEKVGLPLSDPLEFLDFGCGVGFMWDHLTALGANWRYSGVDFSPESVTSLSGRAVGRQNFETVALIEKMPTPFPDRQFDLIFLIEVVEHLTDAHLEATLVEVHRLLKSGGRVVVTTPNDEDLSLSTRYCPNCCVKFHEWQHIRSWSPQTLTEAFAQRGMALESAKTLDFRELGSDSAALRLRAKRLFKTLSFVSQKQPHLMAIYTK